MQIKRAKTVAEYLSSACRTATFSTIPFYFHGFVLFFFLEILLSFFIQSWYKFQKYYCMYFDCYIKASNCYLTLLN